jgi:DNA topoisomerase VI subunit B
MAKSKKQNKEIQISKSPAAMSMLGLPEVQIPVTPAPVGKRKKKAGRAYFRISVRDNGCGMSHDAILNLLGRVLSGSK